MRKFLTSGLTVLVLSAAIFTCCGEMKAFASLFASPKAHDCCKKNLPESSEHQCDCHHEVSALPSQVDTARLLQNALTSVTHLVFTAVDVPSVDHLAAAVFYNGPPDDRVSQTPLYYQFSNLRL